MDCIFCKLIAGEIPGTIIYKNKYLIAIDDLHPRAPQHKLIIPLKHISTLNDLTNDDAQLIGQMTLAAKDIAKQLGIADSGYRIIFNCNPGAGQTVFHIHMHLLGGRVMNWPPG